MRRAVLLAALLGVACFDAAPDSSASDDEAARAAGREMLRRYADDDPYATRPSPERDRDLAAIRQSRADLESEASGANERFRYGGAERPPASASVRPSARVRELADRHTAAELKRKMDAAYLEYQTAHRDGFALWAADAHKEYVAFKDALELKRRQ